MSLKHRCAASWTCGLSAHSQKRLQLVLVSHAYFTRGKGQGCAHRDWQDDAGSGSGGGGRSHLPAHICLLTALQMVSPNCLLPARCACSVGDGRGCGFPHKGQRLGLFVGAFHHCTRIAATLILIVLVPSCKQGCSSKWCAQRQISTGLIECFGALALAR